MASRQRNTQERACEETVKKGEKTTREMAKGLGLRISDLGLQGSKHHKLDEDNKQFKNN